MPIREYRKVVEIELTDTETELLLGYAAQIIGLTPLSVDRPQQVGQRQMELLECVLRQASIPVENEYVRRR